MGLPSSRDETCVPDALIKSSLLNNLQDCIVSQKHGDVVRTVGPGLGFSSAGWTRDTTLAGSGAWKTQVAPNALLIEIPLEVGERIKAVSIYCKDHDATRFIDSQLTVCANTGGAGVTKSANVSSAKNGLNQTVVLTGITPEAATAGQVWFVVFGAVGTGGGDRIVYSMGVTIDKP